MRTKTDSYCSELQTILNQRMRAGGWHPIFLADLSADLTLRQLAVLSVCLNLAKERADADGWLVCTPSYLSNGPLHLSKTAQEEALGALTKLGLVTVKWRNGTRVVRVNLSAYKSLADGTLADEEDGFDY
jgi:hypothetical protein